LVKRTLQVRFLAEPKGPFTADAEIKCVTYFPGQEKGMSITTYLMKISWTMIPLKNRECVVGKYRIVDTEQNICNFDE